MQKWFALCKDDKQPSLAGSIEVVRCRLPDHCYLPCSEFLIACLKCVLLSFQILQLLELVPELIAIAQCKRKEEEEEQAINRQTALFSLKLLCKGFGTENPVPFVPVLKTAIDLISSEKEEKNVMGSALLCIAEVTCTLKAQAIPQLPRYCWVLFNRTNCSRNHTKMHY